MAKYSRFFLRLGCTIGMLSPVAAGQVPTFSLAATAINSSSVAGDSASRLMVCPGDVVTMEIYIRDWSPNGEPLAAYQAQMDPRTYSTGSSGNVKPIDYDATQQVREENGANCFIDEEHPGFIHTGLKALCLTDTRSEGYRWASVLIGANGPVCEQGGTKYYCGTLKLEVSDDARGTFTIALAESGSSSGLRNNENHTIGPVGFEVLALIVHSNLISLIDGLNETTAGVPGREVDPDIDGQGDTDEVLRVIAMINSGD